MLSTRTFAPLFALAMLATELSVNSTFAADVAAVSAKIDAAILERLAREKVRPAPRADHARLVRRLYLDVLGRIPTAEETRAYLDDSRPDKHHRLIDSLVSHPEFPVVWRKFLDSWLNGPYDRQSRGIGHDEFLGWLQRSIESKKPWDRLARELILPNGADAQQKGASYFLASRMRNDREMQIDNLATGFASGLFGVQLQCAKCHDHPFVHDWKQDHYYGLAAFFGRIDPKNVGSDKDTSEVKFATRKKGEKTAAAIFLDSVVLDVPADPAKKNAEKAVNRRQLLVDHALKSESPYFKRSFVNRMWKQLMGRGLVEPVDQIHDANPASHPKLLEWLADDFAANGFAIERTMLGILHSEAYLRDSRIDASPRPGDETYAAAVLKPLSGEQMAWSMVIATGSVDSLAKKFRDAEPSKAGGIAPSLRIKWEKDVEFDVVIGRFRSGSESFQANVSQALFATFNPFAKKLIEPKANPFVQRLAAEKDDRALTRTAYLAVLSRFPTDAEADDVAAYLRAASDRPAAVGNLLWSLMTTAEFRFNH